MPIISGGSGASTADAVSFTPAGTIAATDAQAAIEEVAAEGSSGLDTLTLASDGPTVVGLAYADAAPGLEVPVANGVPLRFIFFAAFVTNGVGTGARFGLSGAAFTRLAARYGITAGSSFTHSILDAYDDTGPTMSSSADAANNICVIDGIIVPSAAGVLKLRSQAELADPGSVTVKAGSSVLYW